MKILTPDNTLYDLDQMPDMVDDVKFSVLDFSKGRRNIDEPDFYFSSLIFMERFSTPAALLQIGEFELKVPLNWSIMITSNEFDEMCMVPINSIPKRNFTAFVYNPLKGGLPSALPVEIKTLYRNYEWHAPKVNPANLITMPISNTEKAIRGPHCVYIARETANVPKTFSLADILWYEHYEQA